MLMKNESFLSSGRKTEVFKDSIVSLNSLDSFTSPVVLDFRVAR